MISFLRRKGPGQGRALLRDASLYTCAILAGQVMQVISGILLLRWLEPMYVGVWQTVKVILQYTTISEIGTANGIVRQYPYYLSRGEHSYASESARTAYGTNLASAVLVGIVLLVIAGIFALVGNELMAGSIAVTAVLASFWQLFFFLDSFFVGSKQFGAKSLMQIIFAGTFLIGILFAAHPLTLQKAFLVCIFSYISPVLFAFFRFPEWNKPSISRNRFWELVRIGFPVTIRGFATIYLRTADLIVIGAMLPFEELGFYRPAVLLSNMIILFSVGLQHAMGPRVIEIYGRREDIRETNVLLRKTTWAIAVFSGIAIPLAILSLRIVIGLFLPLYEKSQDIARYILIGTYFFSLTGGTGGFFLAKKKMLHLAGIQVLSALVVVSGSILAIRLNHGVLGVALATAFGYLIYAFLHLGFVFLAYVSFWKAFQRILLLCIPGLLGIGLLILSERFFSSPSTEPGRIIAVQGIRALFVAGIYSFLAVPSAIRLLRKE